jgi:hypothetical protein
VSGMALGRHGVTDKAKSGWRWWQRLLVAMLVAVVLPIVAVVFAVYFLIWFVLHVAIWIRWCARGRDILFVYSDSPVWREYVEQHILPHLGGRAIVLNWSQRRHWRLSLARFAFRFFGGDRQFTPMAVVFRPFQRARVFRFWQPFRDFKHGRPESLNEMRRELFELMGIDGENRAA